MTSKDQPTPVSDIARMVDHLLADTEMLYTFTYGSDWPYVCPRKDKELEYTVRCLKNARDIVKALETGLQSDRFESLE